MVDCGGSFPVDGKHMSVSEPMTEKTTYEVNMGILFYRPDGIVSILAAPVEVPVGWLKNWRSDPVMAEVPPDAPPEVIVDCIAKEMLTDRYRDNNAIAAELLRWAATFPFVSEHAETNKSLPVWPADLTLVIYNYNSISLDWVVETESVNDFLARQRRLRQRRPVVQATMLDFDEDGKATDLITLEMDADGKIINPFLEGGHRNRMKWLH
jgi:hypothetical protein